MVPIDASLCENVTKIECMADKPCHDTCIFFQYKDGFCNKPNSVCFCIYDCWITIQVLLWRVIRDWSNIDCKFYEFVFFLDLIIINNIICPSPNYQLITKTFFCASSCLCNPDCVVDLSPKNSRERKFGWLYIIT